MNILFTYPSPFDPQRGGVERVTDILCREFLNKGHEVFYLNCYQENVINIFQPPVETFTLPEKQLFCLKNKEFYYRLLQEKKIEVIINQEGMFEFCPFFTDVSIQGIKVISVIHSNPLLDYDFVWKKIATLRNGSLLEKLKRIVRCCLYLRIKKQHWKILKGHYEVYKNNSSYVALLSNRFEESLFKVAPFLRERTFAIPNPSSFPITLNDVPNKKKEVLFVGRLDNKSKQVTKLLNIWKNIQNQIDWNLTIIGDGPDRNFLETVAKKKRLKRCNFLGFVNPEAYYQRASVLCMTSLYEGFGMVLVEAMQFGCIPMAFDSFASVRDIIKDGENGCLVAPFDEKEYAFKLKNLMNNSIKRQTMSRNCLKAVIKFDSKHISDLWLNKIERIK